MIKGPQKDYDAWVRSLPQHDLVMLGAELWAQSEKIRDDLEHLKNVLRTRVPTDIGQHTLEGEGVTCLITVPKPHFSLAEDTDLDKLRELLGSGFGSIFKETCQVTPAKGFEEAFELLPCKKAEALRGFLEVVQGKARVTFRTKDVV